MKHKYFLKYPWLRAWYNARSRCIFKNRLDYPRYGGKGIKFLLTKEEIKELWFRDKGYLLKKPSIDRIKFDKDYYFDNCRFIEWGANTAERNQRVLSLPVIQYSLQNNYIQTWKSAREIQRILKINQSNISKCCRNLISTTGGFKWKYKK